MSYKVMFILNALVLLAVGLGLLFVPDMVLAQFGTEAYASTVFVSRFFGLTLATLGLMLWFAGDVAEATIQKRMAVTIFVASVAGLVLSLVGMSGLSGVLRVNGWMPLVLFVLGALGYGFLLFLKPRMNEAGAKGN